MQSFFYLYCFSIFALFERLLSICLFTGVHDEGGIINALFGLIFWDIIYDYPVPDVFRNCFQREPLDLCSGEFYKNRRKVIDGRLEELCNWSMDQARDFILNVLREHENEESVVRWQRFQGIDEIMVSAYRNTSSCNVVC